MKLLKNIIHVNNLEESIRFYENILDLKLVNKFNDKNIEIAFLKTDSFIIELIKDKEEVVSLTEDIAMGFTVESVDKIIEELNKKGIEIHSGPIEPAPNVKFIFIKDPNGLLIQLAE